MQAQPSVFMGPRLRGDDVEKSVRPKHGQLPRICMPNISSRRLTRGPRPTKLPPVHAPSNPSRDPAAFVPDSRRAWARLAVAVAIGSLGSVGMWAVVVALPVVQAEFGASRGTASLAFTFVMLGFGRGGGLKIRRASGRERA